MALLGLLSITLPRAVQASTITYTESATASGALDGTPFTNSLVTLSLTGDTSSIFAISGGFQINGTATVSVSGGGSDTFSDLIGVYVFNAFAGFTDVTRRNIAIFGDSSSPSFVGYGLATALGPISNSVTDFNLNTPFNTTGGSFDMTALSGNATFTAAPAPEPSSLFMLATGLGLLGFLARKTLARDSSLICS
jgi:hypothetical protein